jgi:TonB family protein
MIISTLASGLFYGLYCLTLRRDRWLQHSRAYLIFTLVFSMALPLVQLPVGLFSRVVTTLPAESLLLAIEGSEVEVVADAQRMTAADLLPAAYLVGLAITLVYLLVQMAVMTVTVVRLRRRHTVYTAADGFDIPQGAKLILLDDDTAPYSFFNNIVVGTRDLGDDELRCILAHESLHVHRAHSIDLLAMRIMCCVAWFNPFAWLLTREMRAVHEYQADAASLDSCSRESYLHLLYRQVTGIGYGHITNNFQSINIKNRIVMMNKTKTRFGAWKVAAALPVAVLLLMVGCKPAATESPAAEEQVAAAQEATVEPIIFKNDSMPDGLVAPEFPDGGEALYKYIAENLHYPEQAKADGIEGRVVVQFTVMDNGDIVNVEIAKGIGGGCDEEALRVIKSMPKWKPAIYEGKAVNVQYCIPINFKLR